MNESRSKIESLYIHFPFCRHLCNYCDFFKYKTDGDYSLADYHHYLKDSFQTHEELLTKEGYYLSELETLYIGGGTPSLWDSSGNELLKVSFKTDYEATMELNPGSWSRGNIEAWQEFGVNRFSIGLQSTDDFYLKALDRVHNRDEVFKTLKSGWDNFSVDFMLGLPFSQERKRDIIVELKEILEFNPKHISLYILTIGQNYPHYNKIPDEDYIRDEYLKVADFLSSNGFNHYEVSNFSKPGFDSRHNLKYWACEPVAALGPSATGLLISGDEGVRYKWKGTKAEYQLERLGRQELDLERVYMGLRSKHGLDLNEHLGNKYIKVLSNWESLGYISKSKNGYIVLSSLGYLMLDSLMNDIFIADRAE